MAFTKIQPQQVQLATFLSHSGHLTFTDLTTGVEVYINELLSGDFNFTGSLKFEDADVLSSNPTNTLSGSAKVVGGSNNLATGNNHVIINGDNNTIRSGNYNTILAGRSCYFGQSGQYNTIVGGRSAYFGDKVTGSMIIADQATANQTINKNHSLLVSFDSGIDFKAPNSGINFYPNTVMRNDLDVIQDLDVQGNVNFAQDLTIEGDFSATDGYSNFSSAEFAGVVSGTQCHFSNYFSGLDGIVSGILSGNSGTFQNAIDIEGRLTVDGALTGTAARFTSDVVLKDSSEAVSKKFLTGGLSSSEGFVEAVSPATPTNASQTEWGNLAAYGGGSPENITSSYIEIPVSGHMFRIFGVWDHT